MTIDEGNHEYLSNTDSKDGKDIYPIGNYSQQRAKKIEIRTRQLKSRSQSAHGNQSCKVVRTLTLVAPIQ